MLAIRNAQEKVKSAQALGAGDARDSGLLNKAEAELRGLEEVGSLLTKAYSDPQAAIAALSKGISEGNTVLQENAVLIRTVAMEAAGVTTQLNEINQQKIQSQFQEERNYLNAVKSAITSGLKLSEDLVKNEQDVNNTLIARGDLTSAEVLAMQDRARLQNDQLEIARMNSALALERLNDELNIQALTALGKKDDADRLKYYRDIVVKQQEGIIAAKELSQESVRELARKADLRKLEEEILQHKY